MLRIRRKPFTTPLTQDTISRQEEQQVEQRPEQQAEIPTESLKEQEHRNEGLLFCLDYHNMYQHTKEG